MRSEIFGVTISAINGTLPKDLTNCRYMVIILERKVV
jgi:hypothetical protein